MIRIEGSKRFFFKILAPFGIHELCGLCICTSTCNAVEILRGTYPSVWRIGRNPVGAMCKRCARTEKSGKRNLPLKGHV